MPLWPAGMSKIQRSEDFQISEIKTNDIAVDAEENMKGLLDLAIFGVDARDNSIEKSTTRDLDHPSITSTVDTGGNSSW